MDDTKPLTDSVSSLTNHDDRPQRRGQLNINDRSRAGLASSDIVYATSIAVASLLSYAIMTHLLLGIADADSRLLGGMWAAVASVFVYRDTRMHSLVAGIERLIATCVSFALCLAYLLLFPFTPVGMAVLIGLGTLAMMALGRRDDIITTGITTAVVMVVAAISPADAWQQPPLRLADTVVGIAVGVACKWAGSVLFSAVGWRDVP